MKNMEKKNKAFTLAEVLITLVVIGVVASLTIPTLTSNHQDKALKTQRKKAISSLSNGFRLLMAEDGVTTIENTKMYSCGNDKACLANEIKRTFNVAFDNTFDNNIFNMTYRIPEGRNDVEVYAPTRYSFATSDGMMVKMKVDTNLTGRVTLMVDVNGPKKPNMAGKDLCYFVLTNKGKVDDACDDGAYHKWPYDN